MAILVGDKKKGRDPLPAPAIMIRLLLGEFGSVILKGQRAIPRRLVDSGFVFQYPEIEGALASIVNG